MHGKKIPHKSFEHENHSNNLSCQQNAEVFPKLPCHQSKQKILMCTCPEYKTHCGIIKEKYPYFFTIKYEILRHLMPNLIRTAKNSINSTFPLTQAQQRASLSCYKTRDKTKNKISLNRSITASLSSTDAPFRSNNSAMSTPQ